MTPESAQAALKLAPLDLSQFDRHTPGDWIVEFDRHETWPQRVITTNKDYHHKYRLIAPHSNDALATTFNGDSGQHYLVTHKEESANYRLIAAAPRLLDELRRTRDERDALNEAFTTQSEWHATQALRIDVLEAALKALDDARQVLNG